MLRNRWNVRILLVGIITMVVTGGFKNAEAKGKYAAEFLRIGVGARPLAMGGAFVALANDGTAFYWNPAGLSNVPGIEVNFEHADMFGGLAQYNAGSAALCIGRNSTIGVSWIRLAVNDIPRYSELPQGYWDRITNPALRSTGEAEGYFGDSENAFMFSFARKFEFELNLGGGLSPDWIPSELAIGVSYKYIDQHLDNSRGSGQGIDAGALFRMMSNRKAEGAPFRSIAFGVNLQDVAKTTVKWNTASNAKDVAALTLKVGAAVSQWIQPLRTDLTLVFDKDTGESEGTYFGGELAIKRVVALRMGSHDNDLTVGVGLRIKNLRLDYACVGYQLQTTHRVSGAVHF